MTQNHRYEDRIKNMDADLSILLNINIIGN